jgi:hypothetical protein
LTSSATDGKELDSAAHFELAGMVFTPRVLSSAETAAVCVRVRPPEAVHAHALALTRAP